jgi:hypothetical protein
MPQRIDVPGMGIVEFPDGMSDGAIAAAIKSNMKSSVPSAATPSAANPSSPAAVSSTPAGQVSDEDLSIADINAKATRQGPGIISRLANVKMSDIVKGAAHGIMSGLTLPGDVATGKAVLPSHEGRVPGTVPFGHPESAGERVADLAGIMSPINPAVRAGDRAITGAVRATPAVPPAPSSDWLKLAADAGYGRARNLGVEIKPEAIRTMATDLGQSLEKDGINGVLAPKTFSGSTATISNFETMRRAFGHAAGDTANPTERLAASRAIEHLDDYLADIPAKDVRAGDAAAASKLLEEARGNYAAAKRSEDVGARLTRAERQAARSGSGSNVDNAIRQKISAILDVPSRTRGFSADELAQMETVVRGTGPANVARKIGKLGFSDGLSLMLHAGAVYPTSGMSIPIGIAGTASRKIAEALTARQAMKLDEMIRARSPLAEQAAASEPMSATVMPSRTAIARALMLGLHPNDSRTEARYAP